MNIITKSGTNQFHGSAFWVHNSNKLNSRSNLDKNLFAEAPWRINNQFGFTAGGPVWIPKVYNGKDKTFFFAAGQKWTDRKLGSGSTISGVPTDQCRQLLQPYANLPAVKALLDFLPAAQVAAGDRASRYAVARPRFFVHLVLLRAVPTDTLCTCG